MMKLLGYVRWEPSSRAGAVAVTKKREFDMDAVSVMADAIMDWAIYQNIDGVVDGVEPSSIDGTYDWRAYLREESELAQRREARKAKANPPPPAPVPSAPTGYYA